MRSSSLTVYDYYRQSVKAPLKDATPIYLMKLTDIKDGIDYHSILLICERSRKLNEYKNRSTPLLGRGSCKHTIYLGIGTDNFKNVISGPDPIRENDVLDCPSKDQETIFLVLDNNPGQA